MISIDPLEYFNPWMEKPADGPKVCEWEKTALEEAVDFGNLNFLLQTSPEKPNNADGFFESLDFGIDINDLELDENAFDITKILSPAKINIPLPVNVDDYFNAADKNPTIPDALKLGVEGQTSFKNAFDITKILSPAKINIPLPVNVDDYFIAADKNPFIPDALKLSVERQTSSPDSGIELDRLSSPIDDYVNVFSLMEQDKDVEGMCEPLKLNNDSEMDKYIYDVFYDNKYKYIDDLPDPDEELLKPGGFISLSGIFGNQLIHPNNLDHYLNPKIDSERPRIDSVSSDRWLHEYSKPAPPAPIDDDFSALYASLVLQPVKPESLTINIEIDEEVCLGLYILRKNSQTIQLEHSYHKRPCITVESDEDDVVPVKKRKRDEVDEDFSPYQKPKRKVGRPRTTFSKAVAQKQKVTTQKTRTPPATRRTPQATKKFKSSSVPFDKREQHNQAERERRDMLKKNLDIVEDMTPDHILQLTQTALQSEKTGKPDEFENNENNFTVGVLKKLDELVKREPLNQRPKYKKASRNSKMVVLLGSTYYISSLEKELKAKENRLAQLKKQYEECLKRVNPTRVSSKKVRRHY